MTPENRKTPEPEKTEEKHDEETDARKDKNLGTVAGNPPEGG